MADDYYEYGLEDRKMQAKARDNHDRNGNEVTGTAGDDLLNGGRGDDMLSGLVGFDVLRGRGGDDRLFGGTQNDFVFGGNGDDVLHGDSGPETGSGQDLGADRLDGGNGNDTLYVGDGLDVLTGGNGADTFHFRFTAPVSPAAAGTAPAFASITDFDSGDDTLAFDVPGVGDDLAGASFAPGETGDFFSGAAADAGGERVVVITDRAFASGALAVQAAANEGAGDFVIYFNTTVNTGSLLVISAPDTAVSIARFTGVDTFEEFQAISFTAEDFMFV